MKKNTGTEKPRLVKIKNGRIMLSSSRVVCESKKLAFVKEQEAKVLLSMIGKIPSLGDLLL